MKFRMKYDKLSRYVTVIVLLIVVGGLAFVFYTSGGSYFPAWLTTLAVSIALLITISIPRRAEVTQNAVEIYCVLEIKRIPIYQINRVKLLDRRQLRWCVPIFGICWIFGYFGCWVDLKRFRCFTIYSRRWSNFVLIEDVDGNSVIVGVEEPSEFIKSIDKLR